VESTVGKGSIFWIELIRERRIAAFISPPTHSAGAASVAIANVRSGTLLYVETSPAYARNISSMGNTDVRSSARATASGH